MAADLQGAPLLQEVQENLAMKGIANREASSVSLPQGWTLPKELTLPRAVPDTLHTVQLSAVQWAGLLSVVAGVIGIATARAKTSGQSPRAAGADLERFIPGINSPGERYDPETSRQYFMSRPGVVLRRFLEMAYLTNGWIIGLLYDKYFGKVEENEPIRAEAARQLAIKLGPTFIKLGQALSIRPDLIPKAYSEELRLLQDAVPPFDSNQARAIISMELGITESQMSSIFVQMSSEPVASASIGQVYKAKLQDGRDVAVKVQRPRVPEIIALDLFLVRTLAPIYKKITKTETDLVALVDEWGKGFVDELDYRREAENTTQFRNAMAERGLDAVTAPEVLPELSASRILTTSWVDGCRLDVSKESDVPRLCGVALNAYLSMLLDTGTLHCDPHPGNLLRMSDGRLCILDWGMTTSVQNDIQYSLIEYIAHIIRCVHCASIIRCMACRVVEGCSGCRGLWGMLSSQLVCSSVECVPEGHRPPVPSTSCNGHTCSHLVVLCCFWEVLAPRTHHASRATFVATTPGPSVFFYPLPKRPLRRANQVLTQIV